MNKYSVKLPYYYTQYGYLSGYVFAWDEEEAEELAGDIGNIIDEEYNDSDSGGDTEYQYNEIEVDIEEEDTEEHVSHSSSSKYKPRNELPSYYLSEINFL